MFLRTSLPTAELQLVMIFLQQSVSASMTLAPDTITANARSQTVLKCCLHHCYHIAQEHATFSVPLHLISFLNDTATPLQSQALSASQLVQHCPWLYLATLPLLIVGNWCIPLSTPTGPITLQYLHGSLQISTVQVIHARNNDQIWNYSKITAFKYWVWVLQYVIWQS
jgi:hypothetical protein